MKCPSEVDYKLMLDRYLTTGFQSLNFGLAIKEINQMLAKKFQPVENLPDVVQDKIRNEKFSLAGFERPKSNCTIFFSFTSNLISSGIRDTIRFLAKNNMVDVIITTAGGIEEDFIKCLGETYLGDFKLQGKNLRKAGMNRIGNLIIPNDNYCSFEDWIIPIFDQMAEEKEIWTPSEMIHRLGKEIGKLSRGQESVYYWAWKNKIPVFSPALTDGSIGWGYGLGVVLEAKIGGKNLSYFPITLSPLATCYIFTATKRKSCWTS